MSNTPDQKRSSEEHKLGMALLRKKIITDTQLRAAMDYQRSLGGKLTDVIIKLGVLRPAQIEEFLQNPDALESEVDKGWAEGAIDPSSVKISELKVHRKLLEKVPREWQERFLLVPFFPLPHGDPRKIVMGHGRSAPREAFAKVSAILGVELSSLQLDEAVALELANADTHRRPVPPPPAPVPAKPEARGEEASSDHVLNALLTLLIRKEIITREELETALSLCMGPH